ncbi:MAG: hypothetical protein ABIC36_00420 [bacterium]
MKNDIPHLEEKAKKKTEAREKKKKQKMKISGKSVFKLHEIIKKGKKNSCSQ